jgi:hypothetical protein
MDQDDAGTVRLVVAGGQVERCGAGLAVDLEAL